MKDYVTDLKENVFADTLFFILGVVFAFALTQLI